ncbi:MAG: RsmB/NOP family class I SAM-dependent RNA methyltransferase [Thermodesulfobacteriota bacterium]|nr:RsmB/NOP family class I SAM-dependent RNA methyltransferase [Thermodesulfobacteriota bacterium]
MKPIFEHYCEIIPDFRLFQEYLRKPIPTHIRINTLKIKPDTLLNSLKKNGLHLKSSNKKYDTLYHAPGLNLSGNLLEYFLGYVHPQALTSCLVSIALSPRHNSYILDMCASPGGKTSHIAQLTNNTGLIVANELYPARHIALGHTLDRLGVLNAVITGYQAQEFPLKHRFDYILADVPCSGEGRFRKTKETAVYRETRKKVRLPDLQKKILLRGFDLLKIQGEMIYSTCTFNPDENESVVNFLLENRDADLLPIDLGFDYEPGVQEWKNEKYDKQTQRCARFYPHRINSVGFFMARIGKRG